MSTRRSFAKTIASLLMVPLLKYQPEQIDRHKLLGMFVDDEHWKDRRWDLRKPYVVGDFSYASDGRIMARIDTTEAEHDDKKVKVPPVENAWKNFFTASNDSFKPFRLAEIKELQPSIDTGLGKWGICPACFNRRVSFGSEYPTEVEYKTIVGLDYDPDDNTIRDVSCELCRGLTYTKHCFQKIGGSLITYQNAHKLAAIPGCEVSNGASAHCIRTGTSVPVTLFRSEIGIAGIMMPLIQS